MKYSTRQLKNINKNKELFKPNSKFNSYDVNLNESEEHDKEILKQFFYLRREGFFVAIRQPLKNNQVPDIAVLSTPELITKEICKSESDKRFNEKDYHCKKIKVRC